VGGVRFIKGESGVSMVPRLADLSLGPIDSIHDFQRVYFNGISGWAKSS
jgi:hypothetical protein